MPLHVSSTCAHHQEVKIELHSLWYHHTYKCDDTRGCVIQFWPPDDEHMSSKYVEAWNKLIVKQKFCASSWLITEINILRCTVSKTSKFSVVISFRSLKAYLATLSLSFTTQRQVVRWLVNTELESTGSDCGLTEVLTVRTSVWRHIPHLLKHIRL